MQYICVGPLDKLDKKILYELDLNARQSFSEIAKKVRLSKEVVNYRVKQMETKGIIKGYYTLINQYKLGYMCNRFFIKFKLISTDKEKEIVDYFVKHPKYWWIDTAVGHVDLGAGTWEKDIFGFKERREEMLDQFEQYIADFTQTSYLGFYIYKRAYLVNKKAKDTDVILYVQPQLESVDETDLNLLKEISNNARMPTIEIAKRLNLSVQTITQRLKELQKSKVIESFRPMIDLSKIGYYWYKLFFVLKNHRKKQDILNYCAQHPNIVYAYETTNRDDLELEMEVESYDKFKEILDDIRTKFNDTIDSYRFVIWNKEQKILFFNDDI